MTMKLDPTIMICKGVGCLLRESCKRYENINSDDPLKQYMISMYSPAMGCPNHILKKTQSIMKP